MAHFLFISGFTRYREGNDTYLMDYQMAVSGSYSHPDSHDINGSGFHPYSFNMYGYGSYSQQPYGPPSRVFPTAELATLDDPRLRHPPQLIPQWHYTQGIGSLPGDLGEAEVESQDSGQESDKDSRSNDSSLPTRQEFDQLINK